MKTYQCGSCEEIFHELKNNECPFCASGHWVLGTIDHECEWIENPYPCSDECNKPTYNCECGAHKNCCGDIEY